MVGLHGIRTGKDLREVSFERNSLNLILARIGLAKCQ